MFILPTYFVNMMLANGVMYDNEQIDNKLEIA
jgi:hypothetical protein